MALRIEDVLDEIVEVRARVADLLDLLLLRLRQRPIDALDEHVGEPEHRVERRPQLVAHGSEELRALPVGRGSPAEIAMVRGLGGCEACDEIVESARQRADFVHGAKGHGLARGLASHFRHAMHTL